MLIEVKNILWKPRKNSDVEPTGERGTEYNAVIEPGKSIRLHGIHQNKPFDVSFQLGGRAAYGSYNLTYTGNIVSIAGKTVSIKERYSNGSVHRLSLYEFSWRNYNFDAVRIDAENEQTSQYI